MKKKIKQLLKMFLKTKYIKTSLKILLTIILYYFFQKQYLKITDNIPGIRNINKDQFFRLKDKPQDQNNILIQQEKQSLLNFFSNSTKRNITYVDTVFVTQNFNFGNQMIIINKIIFYCEILGCKRIILDKNINWFIKNRINYMEYNMTIEVGERKDFRNYKTIFDNSDNFLYYYSIIKPEFRADVIKHEILNNLPKVEVNTNDLFIYIRSGDIFKYPHVFYSQPPLCFYKNIIKNNKFRKIYIIAQDNFNPVINNLLYEYPYIQFDRNPINIDIAYLMTAYNIVGGISTFINVLLRLNDNLEFFWEYDIDSLDAKIIHFHHSLYKPFKNITYYRMEPSNQYKSLMNIWNGNETQINLMLKDNCTNNFTIINDFTND